MKLAPVLCLLLILASSVAAQRVTVPVVGCKSDGQTGPLDVPERMPRRVQLDARSAQLLAYYYGVDGLAVLAPRGWYCYCNYGSGGSWLSVSPRKVDADEILTVSGLGFAGPAIQVGLHWGGTSGRFSVAEVIARVFPSKQSFVNDVKKLFEDLDLTFPTGPYPKDTLRYRSKTVVEYRTPAQTEGLGTYSALKMNDSPIEGAAIVTDQPNLLHLSMRLPASYAPIKSIIIRQFETDVKKWRY